MEPGALHKAGQPGQRRSSGWACAGGWGTDQGREDTGNGHTGAPSNTQGQRHGHTPPKLFRQKRDGTALQNLRDRTMKMPGKTRTQRLISAGGRAAATPADPGRRTPRTPTARRPRASRVPPAPALRAGARRQLEGPPGPGTNPALTHPPGSLTPPRGLTPRSSSERKSGPSSESSCWGRRGGGGAGRGGRGGGGEGETKRTG